MNKLILTKLCFTLEFTRESRLPQFVGNTIRGAFGQSLHDNFRLAYDAIYKIESSESVPNPFVISAPYPSRGMYSVGDTLDFSVTLFGSACCYEEETIGAVRSMCNGKLAGASLASAECEYSREWSDLGAEGIPAYDAVTICFVSPTEMLSGKQPVLEPDFSTFIDRLFGRVSAICDTYGESEFVVPYSLVARKPLVRAEYSLKPVSINSNNQPISGFIGKVSYFGDIARYLPYIDLGSQMHIGKKTTRSCGEYYFVI